MPNIYAYKAVLLLTMWEPNLWIGFLAGASRFRNFQSEKTISVGDVASYTSASVGVGINQSKKVTQSCVVLRIQGVLQVSQKGLKA